MCGVSKYLDYRLFLEYGDVQNLENRVEAQVQIQPLLDDGHQYEDRDGDPHLRLHVSELRPREEGEIKIDAPGLDVWQTFLDRKYFLDRKS
jgi:hypothetical protein